MTNAERQKRYRERRKSETVTPIVTESPENVTDSGSSVTENPSEAQEIRENTRTASLKDYHDNPQDYALRGCAELLNWGAWMCESELEAARLRGNRVPIPGDWDYEEGS